MILPGDPFHVPPTPEPFEPGTRVVMRVGYLFDKLRLGVVKACVHHRDRWFVELEHVGGVWAARQCTPLEDWMVRFNPEKLHADLDVLRMNKDLSWRALADQAGVSTSSVSRLQSGASCDADTLAKVLHWAGLPFDRYIEETAEEGGK